MRTINQRPTSALEDKAALGVEAMLPPASKTTGEVLKWADSVRWSLSEALVSF